MQLKAITDKWDGQAAEPLADEQMSILAELLAYMKFLPSQVVCIIAWAKKIQWNNSVRSQARKAKVREKRGFGKSFK